MGEAEVLERAPQLEVQFALLGGPNLGIVEDDISHLDFPTPEVEAGDTAHLAFETSSLWMDAAIIPELAAARKNAMLEAETLLEARMQHLRDCEYDLVPLDIDPLGTAARVVKAKKIYGENSLEYKKARNSLEVDCRRLFAEAWRKNSWEYFEPLEQPFDADRDCYTFMGRSLTEMVADGVTPLAEAEERTIRLHEFVEEKTAVAAQRLGAISLKRAIEDRSLLAGKPAEPAITINTINECPDWAIENYKAGRTDMHGGYNPKKETMMVRSMRIKNGIRYQEQLAVPVRGKNGECYFTRAVIIETMRRMGVINETRQLSKTEVRATQMINMGGEGVLHIVKKLDDVASELSGETIFLGEKVSADHPRDYASIPAEARERQEKLKADGTALADKLIDLEENQTDHFVANGIVSAFVTNRLLQKVKTDVKQAEIAFDSETASLVREYQARVARGELIQAQLTWANVEATAPPASFCGAGSCGLEGVDPQSKEGKAAMQLGLKANNSKELLKDKERACPGCKKKTIYYDLVGSKACISCNKKDIKSAK